MKPAVKKLAQLSDESLFKEVSEGIPLIIKNAIELNRAARSLYENENYRVSKIVREIAEEEAAKVMILIDLIRCPLSKKQRRKITAKRFRNHVAKRIYAMACSYPPFDSFQELSAVVETESLPYYLDGPNRADWIFRNEILASRERQLYVDYVEEITEGSGDCFWIQPNWLEMGILSYETPDCIKLIHALSEVGAGSIAGLECIAKIWRKFTPCPNSSRKELEELIKRTLVQLSELGKSCDDHQQKASFIIDRWPFPMWSLKIEDLIKFNNNNLEDLREKRKKIIQWIEEIDARRDPPPAISRSKVEELTIAYGTWNQEVEKMRRHTGDSDKELPIDTMNASEISKWYELTSYTDFKEKFDDLTLKERIALLALGWYARPGLTDWTENYRRATDYLATGDNEFENYEIAQGFYWLRGMELWEAKPQPFTAGQLRGYG